MTYNHDEEIDDLLGVSFDIEDEGIGDVGRRCEDDDDLHTSNRSENPSIISLLVGKTGKNRGLTEGMR